MQVIQPRLTDWAVRKWGELSFRTTQILTGHGCFGAYLYRIDREDSAVCHHCGAAEDTAQHTYEECPAWGQLRAELSHKIGWDLSLRGTIDSMLETKEQWNSVVGFCDKVMAQKEEAERIRRGEGPRGRPAAGRARWRRAPRPRNLGRMAHNRRG